MTMTIENENTENTADTSIDTSVDTSTETVADTSVDESAPKSMLEAIEAAVPDPNKVEELKPEAKPDEVDPEAKPETEEDATKMPEGLTPKAQERFQKLATDAKAARAEVEHMTSVIEPFRQSLQENNVSREQFDMATAYIGLVNKNDLEGAYKLMEGELRSLSLRMGRTLGGVDALSNFSDLRNAVDTFQITEEHALELARQRNNEQIQTAAHQQAQQRQQQVEQRQQQERQSAQVTQQGTAAVDTFCKQMMKSDLDYAKVEAILLPQIQSGLLQDVPPARWAAVVESTYKMIKASAGASKQTPSVGALRATGTGSPSQAPKSMMDAMFPNG